ncbi:MAG TPA: hypothetical protein VNS58_02385 [Puia sp.]|nr:hypothetical protein [Puia sp.]
MEILKIKCESCKTNLIEILEHIGEGIHPYRLCHQCYTRLINKALRPLEFFNLAAIHGSAYYLHDDFYDSETGNATQPDVEVIESEKFPYPDINQIKGDLRKLIDFGCVQYDTSVQVIQQITAFDKETVLEYLKYKVDYNRAINYKAYEIAAKVLGPFASDWLRQEWQNRKVNEVAVFAEAIAACLPFDEAFEIITKEIEHSPNNLFTDNSSALFYFQSNKTLSWIEKNKERIINVSTNWGALAASSKIDWGTINKWLNDGRPLSLVALDALFFCTSSGDRRSQPLWIIQHPPTLLEPVDAAIIATTVSAYLEKDNVPRTKSAVRSIIDNLFATG